MSRHRIKSTAGIHDGEPDLFTPPEGLAMGDQAPHVTEQMSGDAERHPGYITVEEREVALRGALKLLGQASGLGGFVTSFANPTWAGSHRERYRDRTNDVLTAAYRKPERLIAEAKDLVATAAGRDIARNDHGRKIADGIAEEFVTTMQGPAGADARKALLHQLDVAQRERRKASRLPKSA